MTHNRLLSHIKSSIKCSVLLLVHFSQWSSVENQKDTQLTLSLIFGFQLFLRFSILHWTDWTAIVLLNKVDHARVEHWIKIKITSWLTLKKMIEVSGYGHYVWSCTCTYYCRTSILSSTSLLDEDLDFFSPVRTCNSTRWTESGNGDPRIFVKKLNFEKGILSFLLCRRTKCVCGIYHLEHFGVYFNLTGFQLFGCDIAWSHYGRANAAIKRLTVRNFVGFFRRRE